MRIKNDLKFYAIFFLIMSTLICIIFNPYISDLIYSSINTIPVGIENTFIVKYDWTSQHIPFYSEFFNLLDNGKIAWSWNQFLGVNFYASKAYYLIGDPFAYVSYFINQVTSNVPLSLFIITIIKIYVASFTFSLLLKKLKINNKWIIAFSVLYAFSGWLTTFIEQPVFISFYAMVPLVLLGAEYVLQDNRFWIIMLSSTIVLMMNYYLAWMICLYLLVYWICRYYLINQGFKCFFKLSIKMLCAFMVGVLISSIIWLPSLMHLLSNPRISSEELIHYDYWSINQIVLMLRNFFVPMTKYNELSFKTNWYYFNQIGIYSTQLTLLVIPQLFKSTKFNKFEKKAYGFLVAFCLLTLISPTIGKIFHFTYSLRYTLIISLTMLILSAITLSKTAYLDKKLLTLTTIVILILSFISGVVYPVFRGTLFGIEIQASIISIICIIIYYFLLCFYDKKWFQYIIVLILLLEVTIMSKIVIDSQKNNDHYSINYMYYKQDIDKFFNLFDISDGSRVSFVGFGQNANAYFNKMSIETYDSVYQYSMFDFLTYLKEYPSVDWDFVIKDRQIMPLLNVDAVILPNEYYIDTYLYDCNEFYFEQVPSVKGCKLNSNHSFANTVNTFVSKSEVGKFIAEDDYYLHEMIDLINNNAIVDDVYVSTLNQKYSGTKPHSFNPHVFENNHIELAIDMDNDGFLLLSMAYDKGW